MAKKKSWKAERLNRNVCEITIDGEINKDWYQDILLTADRHVDNPHSNRTLQIKHMEEAKLRGAPIVDAGDFFCVMQGKWDPRKKKGDIRPQHNVPNYLDSVVDEAVELFAPYADNIAVVHRGNHEASILSHHETNIIGRLVKGLNGYTTNGHLVQESGYGGWVKLKVMASGRPKQTFNMKVYHGSGGGGPVTKGVIQTNRRAVYLPDADIIVTGHIHEDWHVTSVRERVSIRGKIFLDEQLHICVPTYKEEYGDGYDGFHIERGRPPKPIGATWLRLQFNSESKLYATPIIAR